MRFFIVIAMTFLSFVSFPKKAHSMDPKLKVLMTTAAYGTVGGALLGTASLAFGTNSRAIFQGASIGLWTGLIFGSYIVYSHQNRPATQTDGQYPVNEDSPYNTDAPGEGGVYDDQGYRWNPYTAFKDLEKSSRDEFNIERKSKSHEVPVYLNLLQFNF